MDEDNIENHRVDALHYMALAMMQQRLERRLAMMCAVLGIDPMVKGPIKIRISPLSEPQLVVMIDETRLKLP